MKKTQKTTEEGRVGSDRITGFPKEGDFADHSSVKRLLGWTKRKIWNLNRKIKNNKALSGADWDFLVLVERLHNAAISKKK
jgi:hypothetical protein